MNTDTTTTKLTNPLSDHPTEMWLQAIVDFEAILGTPGYKISMCYWHERLSDEVCLVCMAGASMARRAEDLPLDAKPRDFDDRTALKFCSIDSMRMGRFVSAVNCLPLPEAERYALHKAVGRAITKTDIDEIRVAGDSRDWHGLIELLRKAIARIDAEHARLSLPPDDHPGWDRLTDALNTR